RADAGAGASIQREAVIVPGDSTEFLRPLKRREVPLACVPDSAYPLPTGTVGSFPSSSTQTQPYWVLLGLGCCRYSSRSCVSLSALIAWRFALGSTPNSLAAFRPRI